MTVPASRAVWSGPDDHGPVRAAPTPAAGSSAGAACRLRRVAVAQRDLARPDLSGEDVLQRLAGAVLEIFDATGALAAEPVGDQLVCRASVGSRVPPVGATIARRGTIVGLAMRSLEPQLSLAGGTRSRSSLVAPLVHDGTAIGLVSATSPAPDAFDEEDVELLRLVAAVAAAALSSAQQRTRERSEAARSAAILESLDEGVVEIDLTGRVTWTNTRAQQMFGTPAGGSGDRAVETPAYEYLWQDGAVRPVSSLPFARVLATGEAQHDEVVGLRHADGRLWWMHVNAAPRVVDGEVVSVVTSFRDVTEHRDQELATHVTEARLHAARSLTGLAWWSYDIATGQHEWSDEMFLLLGLEPTDQAPDLDTFYTYLHPDDRPSTTEVDGTFGTGHRQVFRVVHADGSIRYLQSWNDVETDESGRPIRVVGATIDVTDREEANRSLAVSRGRLSAALDLTATATWEWDIAADRVHWSDRMVTLMGRAPDAPPPGEGDFLACVHPEDRARMAELGRRQIENARGEEAVYRVLHADGSVRHVRALTDVRKGKDGTVTHLWGTAVDVTEQVESAARLAASEEHFRMAFDNAPIGMSMISLAPSSAGRYLRANDAFLEMVGYPRDELMDTPLLELTHNADRGRDAELFDRLVRGEAEHLSFEKRYVRKDGTTVHAWVRTAVARGHLGEPLFLITHAMDITDQLAEQAELERLALTDNLTGLANRTLLTDRVDQALARLRRTGGLLAMLLLDVDRFKLVNDSLGHQVGDQLLVEMAGRIDSVSRADSTVARLGGDEFVVLVEGLRDPDEIHTIATRLVETLRRPYNLGSNAESFVATVSLGISMASTGERSHVDLYREADLALYRAKDAGRDQYALFDDALRAQAVSRMRAESTLRQAIAQDRLVPVFQPMVDFSDGGTVRGAEALVRIEDSDGTLLAPVEFIDVAEETGLIVEVDSRMFEFSAREYARLAKLPDISFRRMSTNVSARSLEDPSFVDRVRGALTRYGVPGSAIRVELTERSLLTSSPSVRESLERLAGLGLQVGLDDFGTGYSALAYLQRFDLQFLKIDRSFVSRLGVSRRDDAVVAAVVELAHAHEMVVIAEGVETPEQLAALRTMGCDRAQGYLIGRPMRSEALEALLRSDPRW